VTYARYQVIISVPLKMAVLLVVVIKHLIEIYLGFEGACYFYLQDKRMLIPGEVES
jgi:hypothetical protein